jgi:hypothetical protein
MNNHTYHTYHRFNDKWYWAALQVRNGIAIIIRHYHYSPNRKRYNIREIFSEGYTINYTTYECLKCQEKAPEILRYYHKVNKI